MMRSMLWGQPVRRWQDHLRPNFWDLIAFPLLFGLLTLIVVGAGGMTKPFELGTQTAISLDPVNLPYYALRTVLRMFIALGFSFLFTLIYAAAAAKSRMAEKILIPVLDILQSIPILSFLTITITASIAHDMRTFRGARILVNAHPPAWPSDARRRGALYVLEVVLPDGRTVFKIGHTKRPRKRMQELAKCSQRRWGVFWLVWDRKRLGECVSDVSRAV